MFHVHMQFFVKKKSSWLVKIYKKGASNIAFYRLGFLFPSEHHGILQTHIKDTNMYVVKRFRHKHVIQNTVDI